MSERSVKAVFELARGRERVGRRMFRANRVHTARENPTFLMNASAVAGRRLRSGRPPPRITEGATVRVRSYAPTLSSFGGAWRSVLGGEGLERNLITRAGTPAAIA